MLFNPVCVNPAKGAIYGEERVSTLATNDQIFRPADYDNLIVAYRQGAPVFSGTQISLRVSMGARERLHRRL